VSCAISRTCRSRRASSKNSCGASSGVMTCFFSPRRTYVQGRKVSICTPPAGNGVCYVTGSPFTWPRCFLLIRPPQSWP
jgi:hypothetical protein